MINKHANNKAGTERPVVFVACGSGGHVFPAVAMAEYCENHQRSFYFLTDERGARFIPKEFHEKMHLLLHPRSDFLRARIWRLFRKLKPSYVLGFGGSKSFLPLVHAWAMGIRCGVYEFDSVVGKANQMLSRITYDSFSAHFLSSPQFSRVGPMVRKAFYHSPLIESMIKSPYSAQHPISILVVGGSQGAHFWSTVFPRALEMLSAEQRQCINLVHQCPEQDKADLEAAYQRLKITHRVTSFIEDIDRAIALSHVVFTRAGASFLAELAAAGRPAFIVPYPHATRNHQHLNGIQIVQAQGGWLYLEEECSEQILFNFLESILHNPKQLVYAGQNIRSISCSISVFNMYQYCARV